MKYLITLSLLWVMQGKAQDSFFNREGKSFYPPLIDSIKGALVWEEGESIRVKKAIKVNICYREIWVSCPSPGMTACFRLEKQWEHSGYFIPTWIYAHNRLEDVPFSPELERRIIKFIPDK